MKISSIAIRVATAVLVACAFATVPDLSAANPASEAAQGSDAPRLENACVETRALAGSLAAELQKFAEQATQPQWIGYSVPEAAGDREVCCDNYSGSGNRECGTCRLEDGDHRIAMTSRDDSVKLEPVHAIAILFRAADKRIGKIRVVSAGCTVDAGGLSFVWLTGVNPDQSVESLTGYVRSGEFSEHDGRSVAHGALAAIAMHADETTDRALESKRAAKQGSPRCRRWRRAIRAPTCART